MALDLAKHEKIAGRSPLAHCRRANHHRTQKHKGETKGKSHPRRDAKRRPLTVAASLAL